MHKLFVTKTVMNQYVSRLSSYIQENNIWQTVLIIGSQKWDEEPQNPTVVSMFIPQMQYKAV